MLVVPKAANPPGDPSDEELIAAWHSDEHGPSIAERLGMPTHRLYVSWYRLKCEGSIPAYRRKAKPNPAKLQRALVDREKRAQVPPPASDEAPETAETAEADERFSLERASDKMLALLREHHGKDHPSGVRADLFRGAR